MRARLVFVVLLLLPFVVAYGAWAEYPFSKILASGERRMEEITKRTVPFPINRDVCKTPDNDIYRPSLSDLIYVSEKSKIRWSFYSIAWLGDQAGVDNTGNIFFVNISANLFRLHYGIGVPSGDDVPVCWPRQRSSHGGSMQALLKMRSRFSADISIRDADLKRIIEIVGIAQPDDKRRDPSPLIFPRRVQLQIEYLSGPAGKPRRNDTNYYNDLLTKGAVSLISIVLLCVGAKMVSDSVDASYESHVRAFTYLGFAVVFIWGAIALFLFQIIGIRLLN